MTVSDKELDRQFRVLRQTLGVHALLRDRHAKMALIAEIILLGCSVVFCATTFASQELYRELGISGSFTRILLGIASVLAFFAALVMLIVDWKGQAARHEDAARKWGETLNLFRETRREDGSWPSDRADKLSRAYWEAHRNTVFIPERKFNSCKARYLLKVEESKMISLHPGSPRFVLRLILRVTGTARAIRNASCRHEEASDGKKA